MASAGVKVPEGRRDRRSSAGRIKAGGRSFRLSPKTLHVATNATRVLALRPKPQARKRIAKRLRSGKRTVARLEVELTDGGSNRTSERLQVKLRRYRTVSPGSHEDPVPPWQ